MKNILLGILFVSSSALHAQTFTFPVNESTCKATAAICSTLLSIQLKTTPQITVNSVELQDKFIKIKMQTPGYRFIEAFLVNLTTLPNMKNRMNIESATSSVGADKKRIENIVLVGTLN